MDPRVRISFRLRDPATDAPRPDRFLSVAPYRCGAPERRAGLPPSLAGRAVLNFTTAVATDLRIAHAGDSLGQQFVQGFDAAVLGGGHEGRRAVLREYFYEGRIYSHNCLSVAAPVRGGGISAYWRTTDLLSAANRRRDAACAREELPEKRRTGWSTEQALALVGHRYPAPAARDGTGAAAGEATTNATWFPVGPFDGVVMRIPHGWMDISDITRERLVESIALVRVSCVRARAAGSSMQLSASAAAPREPRRADRHRHDAPPEQQRARRRRLAGNSRRQRPRARRRARVDARAGRDGGAVGPGAGVRRLRQPPPVGERAAARVRRPAGAGRRRGRRSRVGAR